MTAVQSRPAYVHGVAALVGWRDATLSLTDLIYSGVRAAVADANIAMSQIDSVVLASHDLTDGRSLSSMVTAPAAGAYLRDEIRLSEDGLAALSLAAARIEAGEAEYSIVAAWARASEGDYPVISRNSFDPGFIQPLCIDEFNVSALRLTGWLQQHPDRAGDRAMAGAARARSAAKNPRAVSGETRRLALSWPLREDDAPATADIMVAAIIGREPSAIRITGVGHGTDQAAIGDRDLPALTAVRDAAVVATRQAGIAPDAFDLYELDGATLSEEAMATEAIGLATAGRGFAVRAHDARVNPSGGSAAAWAYPANGMLRFVEACLQLQGRAGPVQLGERPRTALVSGVSAVATQIATVVALEAVA